jgi:hypothetical protein
MLQRGRCCSGASRSQYITLPSLLTYSRCSSLTPFTNACRAADCYMLKILPPLLTRDRLGTTVTWLGSPIPRAPQGSGRICSKAGQGVTFISERPKTSFLRGEQRISNDPHDADLRSYTLNHPPHSQNRKIITSTVLFQKAFYAINRVNDPGREHLGLIGYGSGSPTKAICHHTDRKNSSLSSVW